MAFDVMGLFTGAVGFGAIVIVVVLLFAVIGGVIFFYSHWKKYQQYKVVIWELDGLGNVRETFDTAGIFVDKKTNNKRFFMKINNVGLDAKNVPYILGDNNKKKVYVVKRGLKNFQFIKPLISSDFKFIITEEDVNWAINSYERQKKIFQSSTLMQYLPFILLAFVSVIILVMFIYFFKDFAVLKDVAIALREASVSLGQSQNGVILS